MKNPNCNRCLELSNEEKESVGLYTVVTLKEKRIRDVYLCHECMKYMKKMNSLIKECINNTDETFDG